MAERTNMSARDQNVTAVFCTTKEAADILGVSLRTVQVWAEAGLLEAWKTGGGHRRILYSSIERLRNSRMPPEPPAAEPALRILLVEDDAAVLSLWERKIARWPMKPQVFSAHNGVEALVRIGFSKPDLLITDLRMPEMDGFQMLRQLRTMPELAQVTMIVVTGLDRDSIAANGGTPEGVLVLRKPIPFDRICDIATVLAAQKQRQNASAA